jgi:AraC-like DNA-binding protein
MRRDYYEAFREIDETSREWGMEIRWAGRMNYPANFELKRVHKRYLLLYILEGSCIIKNQSGESATLEAGTIVLFPPGVQHYSSVGENRLFCFGLSFSGHFIDVLIRNMHIINGQYSKIGINEQLMSKFHDFINDMLTFRKQDHAHIGGAFLELLGAVNTAMIQSDNPVAEDGATNQQITKAAQYIRKRYNLELNIRDVADVAGYSVSWFEHLFRNQYHMSPVQYHIKQRIDKAKELIQINLLNITEISNAVGFKDPFYFSKVFKKETGLPPSSYRKVCLAKNFEIDEAK